MFLTTWDHDIEVPDWTEGRNEESWCGEQMIVRSPFMSPTCTRPRGHAAPHAAGDGNLTVAMWTHEHSKAVNR